MQIPHLIGRKTEASRYGSAVTNGRTVSRREAMDLLVRHFPRYISSQVPLKLNGYHLLKLEENDGEISKRKNAAFLQRFWQ